MKKSFFFVIFFLINLTIISSTSYALTEHIQKIEEFKKLGIKKIEVKCRINTIYENGKTKDIWFSHFRKKLFLDFNLQNIRLEGMGFGSTRNEIKSKNQPFFFTKDKEERYLELVMVIPDVLQIHTFKMTYSDDYFEIINNLSFYYQIYQLGNDSFNNFIKFHYRIGTFKEFDIWKESYPKAIDFYFKDKSNRPNYGLTKIDTLNFSLGFCDKKNIK
jgi:hypothetical protein